MFKNTVVFSALILLIVFSTGYGQKTGVKGRVVDEINQPLKGAQVKLFVANKTDTTDSAGTFFIEMPVSRVLPADPVFNTFTFQNGVLSFNVFENIQKIQIEVFDSKGSGVNKVSYEAIGKGTYSVNILPNILPVAMYFVKLQIGNRTSVSNVINLKNRVCSLPGTGPSFEKSLLKRAAGVSNSIDSIQASKNWYDTAETTLTSYSTTVPDIVLKSKELPPVVNGKTAKTTRYWDCCEPHCGWRTNMRLCDIDGKTLTNRNGGSSCGGGSVFQCMDYAPFAVNNKISFAWVAFNNGGNQCADCYQLALQGALSGKQIVVQSINVGDGGLDAFDLLIPGGGVGANNGCSRQWNNAPLGVTYGGFRGTCGSNKDCILAMCEKAFGNRPDLMQGCNWYLNWFENADNPSVLYVKVPCPKEIKDISGIGN